MLMIVTGRQKTSKKVVRVWQKLKIPSLRQCQLKNNIFTSFNLRVCDTSRKYNSKKFKSDEYTIIIMIAKGGRANDWLNAIKVYQFCKIVSDDLLTIPMCR